MAENRKEDNFGRLKAWSTGKGKTPSIMQGGVKLKIYQIKLKLEGFSAIIERF